MANIPFTNTGHGHVWKRPDGLVARCGGPALCATCQEDQAALNVSKEGLPTQPPVVRTAQIMEVPKHFDLTHYRAETDKGRKFVYCPIGNIISWGEGDYDHRWCHFCGKFFSEL